MKKRYYLPLIGLMLSTSLLSQNYVPLRIDSSYYWFWLLDIKGDTLIDSAWTGYSYDSNDSLIQRRSPGARINYAYAPNTLYLLAEVQDNNDDWYIYSRSETTYTNGKILSKLHQTFENNGFENSSLETHFYNNADQDTLLLLQHWVNNAWNNFYKKGNTFDVAGNKTEEAEYYVDANGEFAYNRGKLFEYNNQHLVQEISLNASITGIHYTARTNWTYGNDHLLDTFSRCNYNYPNNGICKSVSMSTYDYPSADSTIENGFFWQNNAWATYWKEVTYTGPGIYSNKPDSTIYYYYLPASLTYYPATRKYLRYEDLGNDSIYFQSTEYSYFSASDEWRLTRLNEEWYHLKQVVSVDDPGTDHSVLSTAPNPCQPGQDLDIKQLIGNETTWEAFIFDMQGRLVSQTSQTLTAPMLPGVYTILVRVNNQLVGVAKQVVVD